MLVSWGEQSKELPVFARQCESLGLDYDLIVSLFNLIAQYSPILNPNVIKPKAKRVAGSWKGSEFTDNDVADSLKNPDVRNVTGLTDEALKFLKQTDEDPKDRVLVNPEVQRKKRKLNDYERWELQQLQSSGMMYGADLEVEEPTTEVLTSRAEEDIEIVVKETEPMFLKGRTAKSGTAPEGLKVVVNPEGSLAKSAAFSAVLSKERRD